MGSPVPSCYKILSKMSSFQEKSSNKQEMYGAYTGKKKKSRRETAYESQRMLHLTGKDFKVTIINTKEVKETMVKEIKKV